MARLRPRGGDVERPPTDFSKPFLVMSSGDMAGPVIAKRDARGSCSLDGMIGLSSVKEQVERLRLRLELSKKQERMGHVNKIRYNMHMFFTGNPGTGKTTVARIMAGIFHEYGYAREDKLVEAGKQDIVGQYLGQSAQKADAVIKGALGGVLFIDEAYSLCENYQGDGFGRESMEVILKAMEDYRDDLIIIFAGYTRQMADFKKMNPGLKSRIGMTIEFPDYSPEELVQIFVRRAESAGYSVPSTSSVKVLDLCRRAVKVPDFGNGRFVENLMREAEFLHAVNTKDVPAGDPRIMQILPYDVDLSFLDRIL